MSESDDSQEEADSHEDSASVASSDIFDDDYLEKLKNKDELVEFLNEGIEGQIEKTDENSKDATVEGNVQACSRLALRNMQWDVLSAEDILFMLNSFIPSTATIQSVQVWPSL